MPGAPALNGGISNNEMFSNNENSAIQLMENLLDFLGNKMKLFTQWGKKK